MRGPAGDKRIEMLGRETVFKGFFRVDRLRFRHRRYDGGWSGVVTREVFERGRSVCVLLYDPDLDKVVLIEQFRVPAIGDRDGPWLLEVVAGIIEEGEDSAAVARREAIEEAGCAVADLIPAGRCWLSPGGSSEHLDMFVGRVDASRAGGVYGLESESEDIRVVVMGLDEAVAVCGREIITASAIMVVQWLALNRDAVRRRWVGQE